MAGSAWTSDLDMHEVASYHKPTGQKVSFSRSVDLDEGPRFSIKILKRFYHGSALLFKFSRSRSIFSNDISLRKSQHLKMICYDTCQYVRSSGWCLCRISAYLTSAGWK